MPTSPPPPTVVPRACRCTCGAAVVLADWPAVRRGRQCLGRCRLPRVRTDCQTGWSVMVPGSRPSSQSSHGWGWSDFYALDLLVHEGDRTDPAGPGDVWLGEYATGVPESSVASPDPPPRRSTHCRCSCSPRPASGTAGSGGYVRRSRKVGTSAGSVHDGGEIWQQTMWDLRDALAATRR